MDVFKAIETRRSIRKYKQQRIPDYLLCKILEAGRLAPSAASLLTNRSRLVRTD